MRFVIYSILCLLTLSGSAAIADKPESIQQLDWLIGEWTFEDQSLEGSYREVGTRDCNYTLNDTYIVCHSIGTSHTGKTRSYRFYFNYNDRNSRFEMVALTGYYPHKNLYVLTLSEDNHTIELQSGSWTGEGVRPQNEATIEYNGTDRYVWHIRFGEIDEKTGVPAVKFRDTVTRK